MSGRGARRGALASATMGLILAAATLDCAGATSPAVIDGALAIGTWGGDTAGMIVGDTAMHLHIGCTYGNVSGRVAVAADGSFDVPGSYLLRAYPLAVGPTLPARFTGRVHGAMATVTATVNDTVNHVNVVRGPAEVTLGVEPRLVNCPICRPNLNAGSR